jgi:hypothetical protein
MTEEYADYYEPTTSEIQGFWLDYIGIETNMHQRQQAKHDWLNYEVHNEPNVLDMETWPGT